MLCVQRAVPVHSPSTHTFEDGIPDRFATLPEELVREVLGRVDRPTLCALAAVSSDLGVAVHPFVQGHAVDDFLFELVELIEAFNVHEGTFGWADQCQWVREWSDVPVDSVVSWLQALPRDDYGLPMGVNNANARGEAGKPMSFLIMLFMHIDFCGRFPDHSGGWCADISLSPACDEIDALWECLRAALTSLRVRDLIDGTTRMEQLRTRVLNIVVLLDGI